MESPEPLSRATYRLVTAFTVLVVAALVLGLWVSSGSVAAVQGLLVVTGVLALLAPLLPADPRRWLIGEVALTRAESVQVAAVMGVPMLFTAFALKQRQSGMLLAAVALLFASLWYSHRSYRRIAQARAEPEKREMTWRRPTWGRAALVATITIIVGEFVGMVAYFGALVGAPSALQIASRWIPVDADQVLNDPTELNVAVLVVVAHLAVATAIMAVLLVLVRVMTMRLAFPWAFLGAAAAVALEWTANWATDSFQPWSVWTVGMVVPITLVVRWKARHQQVRDPDLSIRDQ